MSERQYEKKQENRFPFVVSRKTIHQDRATHGEICLTVALCRPIKSLTVFPLIQIHL
jgi:hypothetical protein